MLFPILKGRLQMFYLFYIVNLEFIITYDIETFLHLCGASADGRCAMQDLAQYFRAISTLSQ